MEEELLGCHIEYLSVTFIFALGIFILFGVRKFLLKVFEILPSTREQTTPQQKTVAINLHREIGELRRNTQKISKEWEEMVQIINSLKEQQLTFKDQIQNEIAHTNRVLHENFSKSTEEFSVISRKFENMIRIFWGDMSSLKKVIQSYDERVRDDADQFGPLKENLVHMWTQTEHEIAIKKKNRDLKIPDDKMGECDITRNSSGIKKLLIEFQKESRKNSMKMREEVMSHVELILNQMCQDQELIKSSIQQAFTSSSFQTQKNFEQFGTVGQDALQYIMEKTEKSNVLMKDKFQEFDKKLKMVFESMHTTSFDVSSIKSTLDNIDVQLDDIFQRIELGSQKNVEHCEEILGGLETATSVWNDSSARLKEMAHLLTDIRTGVEKLMYDLNEKMENTKEFLAPFSEGQKYKTALVESKSNTSESRTDNIEQELTVQKFIQLQRIVRICTDKVSSLNDRLENGTSEIKMGIENLMRQIRFMCDLVESLGERFKFLGLDPLKGHSNSIEAIKDKEKEIFGDVCDNIELTTEKGKSITDEVLKDSKTAGDTITKTIKKPKLVIKHKQLMSSPMKRGKTIYSSTSSSNNFNKPHERHQSYSRK